MRLWLNRTKDARRSHVIDFFERGVSDPFTGFSVQSSDR